MKLLFLVVALALTACSAGPKGVADGSAPELTPEQKELAELDERLDAHFEKTALPVGAGPIALKNLLGPKVEGIKELEAAYLEFAGGDPELHSHAALRVGQLYLNLACELATLEPADLDPKTTKKLQEELGKKTARLIEKSKGMFANAVEKGRGEHAHSAAQLARMVDSAEQAASCASSEAHWLIDNRPRGVPAAARTWEDCDDARFGADDACREAYARTCEAGNGLACSQLGRLEYEAGNRDDAMQHFERGCLLKSGRACRSAAVCVVDQPARYLPGCKSGDAVDCLQLARVHDRSKPAEGCAAGKVPEIDNALAQCEAGDANGCWAHAAKLLQKAPLELPDLDEPRMHIAMSDQGKLRGKPDERDARKKTLAKQCADGVNLSCATLARMQEEDGEDPRPTLRKGCESGGDRNCMRLAELLLDDGGDAAEDAVRLLHDSCVDGSNNSCLKLARAFWDGDGVRESGACAVSYGWLYCTPENLYACTLLNDIAHD